jgi:hypothetical protein
MYGNETVSLCSRRVHQKEASELFAQTRAVKTPRLPVKHIAGVGTLYGNARCSPDPPMLVSSKVTGELPQPAAVAFDRVPIGCGSKSLLGEFGRIAMQTRDYRQILQRATELCSQGLRARFAKVLEYLPDENRLMVRAGVGWAADTTVSNSSTPAGISSRSFSRLGWVPVRCSLVMMSEMASPTPEVSVSRCSAIRRSSGTASAVKLSAAIAAF